METLLLYCRRLIYFELFIATIFPACKELYTQFECSMIVLGILRWCGIVK